MSVAASQGLDYFYSVNECLHIANIFPTKDLEKCSIGIWESCSSMEKDSDEIEFSKVRMSSDQTSTIA